MDSNEIAKVLDLLAERYGTTAAHLWDVMVRQAIVNGVIGIVVVVVLAIVSYALCRAIDNDNNWEDNVALVTGMMFVFVFDLIALINLVFFALPALLNPEYWALQQLLRLFQ